MRADNSSAPVHRTTYQAIDFVEPLSQSSGRSFYKDLQKLAPASGPMYTLTVATPIPDEPIWRHLTDNALEESSAIVVGQTDMKYGQDRIARIALWRRIS
ncbi:MAG: hypothetical protein OEM29_03145 [Thermoplasmata archaeon]|nr:hypothetical protein [Thermoplasmata archaeon]